MMNKILKKVSGFALAIVLAMGVGTLVSKIEHETVKEASAANSGIDATDGTFVIDFYDSDKLGSTTGTGLQSSNYAQFVKVYTGLKTTDVVTGIVVNGTVQFGKNGGLTAGTGTATGADSHYVTFNIGSNYAVKKATVYATAYEAGKWQLNGSDAKSGTIGTKGAAFNTISNPYVWTFNDAVDSLTFKKMADNGGNNKRLTLYTIVCEYETGTLKPDWEVTGIGVTGTAIAKEIDTETTVFPAVTAEVRKYEHDKNNIEADRSTVVSAGYDLHWEKADGSELKLPITAAGDVNVRVWVSATFGGTTYNSTSHATNKYITGKLTVTATSPKDNYDLSTVSYATATEEKMEWTGAHTSVVAEKGGSSTKTNNYCPPTYTSTRFYKDSTLTFKANGGAQISKVVVEATTTGYATAFANSNWTDATSSASGTSVVLTPTKTLSSFTGTIGANTGLSKIEIYYAGGQESVLSSIELSGEVKGSVESGWDLSGVVVTAHYEDESSLPVTATLTPNPTAPTHGGNQKVTISATYTQNGVTKDTSKEFDVNVASMSREIKEFYDDPALLDTTTKYKVKGTCIGINGNSYYLQDGDYGLLVYGGNNKAPEGLKVGSLVELVSTMQDYRGIVETKTIDTANTKVIGTGTLPAAKIVNNAEEFLNANQSTYVTFNNLNIGDNDHLAWSKIPVASTTDGVATVYDADGAEISLFVSRFLSNVADIKTKLDSITKEDTFDVALSIVAMNSSVDPATKQLSVLGTDQIIVHTPESDDVQVWIDTYMHMDDEAYKGDGTGLCKTNNTYVTAKAALIALGEDNVDAFRNNEEGKYTEALARYLKWAKACRDTTPFEGNGIVLPLNALSLLGTTAQSAITIIIASIAVTLVIGVFAIKKFKKN